MLFESVAKKVRSELEDRRTAVDTLTGPFARRTGDASEPVRRRYVPGPPG